MRISKKTGAALLALAAATVLAAAAVSCSKPKVTMSSEEDLKKTGIRIDAKKGSDKALGDIAEAAKIFTPGRDYVLPLPSTYAEMAKGRSFVVKAPAEVDFGSSYPTLEQSALGMGVRGADGVVLLFADPNDARLERIGDDLLALAKHLGVSEKLSATLAKMAKDLKSGDAAKTRATLDEMVQLVDGELKNGSLNELALLVSLGGWIEMLNVYADGLSTSYNADVAREVLPMTEILDTYLASITTFFGGNLDPASPVGAIYGLLKGPVSADFAALKAGSDEASMRKAVTGLKTSASAMKAAIGKGGK